MCFVHIMASSSKGAVQNWLKFHPNKVFNSVQVYEYIARLGNSGKCKPRCKAVQLWREHSQLQNIHQGLRFNKVLAMAKAGVFLDIKVCTELSFLNTGIMPATSFLLLPYSGKILRAKIFKVDLPQNILWIKFLGSTRLSLHLYTIIRFLRINFRGSCEIHENSEICCPQKISAIRYVF